MKLHWAILQLPPVEPPSATIAILAKPPAAIFAVLFAIYRALFREKNTRLTETRLQRTAEMVVSFVVCSAVLLLVQHTTPRNWIAGAANAHHYLITQPYVALLYIIARLGTSSESTRKSGRCIYGPVSSFG